MSDKKNIHTNILFFSITVVFPIIFVLLFFLLGLIKTHKETFTNSEFIPNSNSSLTKSTNSTQNTNSKTPFAQSFNSSSSKLYNPTQYNSNQYVSNQTYLDINPISTDLILSLIFPPPEYIKDFVVYREGYDGVYMYFILADSNGEVTIADGIIQVTISIINIFNKEKQIYYGDNYVTKEDFVVANLGVGMFSRKSIICPIGRIKYSDFYEDPSDKLCKIRFYFTTIDGRVLKADETCFM